MRYAALIIEHAQELLEGILAVETRVCKPTGFVIPLCETAVIIMLLRIFDEERNNIHWGRGLCSTLLGDRAPHK